MDFVNSFGPTVVLIVGLIYIERQRKKAADAQYQIVKEDMIGIKASINSNLNRAADKIAMEAGKQTPPPCSPQR
tara:strand:- start:491 stop:712 length:222 start_codon:yes stop_codon:yes gene_type:complete